ncbi:MAG: nitrilase [Stappia sp.]|uniref:nitrilase-related carbon-nitrogen hydrolase n=1 Tax=Stappia sp. TaxID=1870903 RepID=UPI000C5F0E11|nr:nitrilase-related carbon-nitrogen hydrolase [Stappia sp.]MAB00788.1 nitrilase [Stappia sp.]MBM22540.1 nitrilase [Stappia sp.]
MTQPDPNTKSDAAESGDAWRIALCAFNLALGGQSPAAFVAGVDARLTRAREEGARLLVLPEYVSEAFLAWKPEGLPVTGELAFMAEEGARILPSLEALVARHGIGLVAGSMPVPDGKGGFFNRAHVLLPDASSFVHDKLALTPFELEADGWLLTAGGELGVFEHEGLRIAVLICLDVEMPALSVLLAGLKPDLLIVPSMTSNLAGYSRVFGCARARAVELMAAVAACGCVGVAEGATQPASNVSGASLFLPCEPTLGYTGIGGEIAATDGMDGEEPFLVADVPIAEIRRLRSGEAEVWPGAWSARDVIVKGNDG